MKISLMVLNIIDKYYRADTIFIQKPAKGHDTVKNVDGIMVCSLHIV